ncbi:Proteasome activator BLM10 [Malassezia vespertilionis]|uniref:Proteasome activator BLM10 n=1 Tax=Malassezia vespertilionis TaxID=2020962 RepID=UPI0024B1A88E|nr:Proteasome activator BLM10 [Malassezia vespertilionis]WFD08563.1 Proteasome activator BLM10 [Malassezia vespertilionis]
MEDLDFLEVSSIDEKIDAEEDEEEIEKALRDSVSIAEEHSSTRGQALLFPRHLPYECESLDAFDALLTVATDRLLDCISAQEFGVAFAQWTQYLQCLMTLKYPLTKARRVQLAQLFYHVAVMPTLDVRVIELASTMCIKLIRSKKELEPSDVALPWRPLYSAIVREISHKARKISTSNISNSLLDLAEYAQRFYPSSEADDMLRTILPQMDGNDINSVIATQAYLVHFLPLSEPQRWLPTMFRLWQSFKSSLFDDQMLDHLARLAEFHVLDENEAQKPMRRDIGIFTDAQFALIMTKCLRSAGLPVGASKAANATLMAQSANVRTGADAIASAQTLRIKKPTDRLRSFALIIVYSMAPDAPPLESARMSAQAVDTTPGPLRLHAQQTFLGGSKALDALAKYIQATESYFHPSNWGMWQSQLGSLVQHLTWDFVRRCKEEELATCKTPQQYRLTPLIKRDFILSLRTVCLLSMFSKDPLSILSAQTSLKRMAYLAPELVIPHILQRSFTSLEALETTHRTTAVISTLISISLPLLSRQVYPAGAKHLAPLLHLCLPGIDLNDSLKTISTCLFILSTMLTIHVEDLSTAPETNDAAAQAPVPLDEEHSTTRAAEDYALCLSTADLDAWVVEFVRRVLHLIDMLPDEGKGGKIGEKNEEMLLNTLIASYDVFCSALGGTLFDRALDIVVEYCRTTVSASGVKVIGSIVRCFARADSAKVMAKLVPLSCARIATELKHGASSVRTTSTSAPLSSDTALHWHISILSGIVMFAGEHIVAHRDQLQETLQLLAEKCFGERGYLLTAKLVQCILHSLLCIYSRDQRSVNPSVWRSEAFQQHSHLYWGTTYTLKDVEIDWHVPNDAEIDMALGLLDGVVGASIRALSSLVQSTTHDKIWHNDFCRHLMLVRFAFVATASLMEPEEGGTPAEHADLGDAVPAFLPPPFTIACGYALKRSDPRYARAAKFRAEVGQVLVRAAQAMHTDAEDQIDASKLLVRSIRIYLLHASYNVDELRGAAKSVTFFRTLGRAWAKQQTYPRILWIRRITLYNLTRMRIRGMFARRTPVTDALTQALLAMCMSNYVAVRKLAQTTLAGVFATYEGTRALCLPNLVTALRSASDDQLKGALYVLSSKMFIRAIVWNQRFTRPLLDALLRAKHAKPSIQKLTRSVLNEIIVHMQEPCVQKAYFPSPALQACTAQHTPAAILDKVCALQTQTHISMDEEHTALVRETLAFAKDASTHWAFALLAMRTLRQTMRRDAAPDAAVAAFVTQECIAENPSMRREAQHAMSRLLYLIKLRSLSTGESLCLEEAHNPLKQKEQLNTPVDPAKRDAALAAFATPLSAASRLHDKGVQGWLAWGDEDVFYVPPPAHSAPFAWDDASDAALAAMKTSVYAQAWWDQLIAYLAQEKERDYLAAAKTTWLKGIFQLFGVGVLDVLAAPVEALVAERDRHKHRAAAEIVSSAFRGSKHWPLDDQKRLWTWCDAWMPRVLAESPPDSQPSWQMCVEYVFKNRDPRRAPRLLAFLLEHAKESLGGSASAASPSQQANAQLLLCSALRSLQHKFRAWGADALMALYYSQFGHDYQEVRRAISEGLVELEYLYAMPSYASVDALLDASHAMDGSLLRRAALLPAQCKQLSSNLRMWRMERVPTSQGTSQYDRAATTSAFWIAMSLDDHRLSPMIDEVIAFLPDLFAMYQLRDNPELSAIANAVLVKVVSFPFTFSQAQPLMRQFLHMIRGSESWHARLDALPLLQIAYFQNLFYLTHDTMQDVITLLLDLLQDKHLEVREMAAATISGIVRCSQRSMVKDLLCMFAYAERHAPLPQRGAPDKEVRLRALHSALLGATALVDAFPYDVPPWMPSLILDTIAPHAEDPVPISTTVRKCAADFRRTHQDTWTEDQAQFGDRVQELHDFTLGRSDYFV